LSRIFEQHNGCSIHVHGFEVATDIDTNIDDVFNVGDEEFKFIIVFDVDRDDDIDGTIIEKRMYSSYSSLALMLVNLKVKTILHHNQDCMQMVHERQNQEYPLQFGIYYLQLIII
jgi:hypothetical protein